MGISPGMKKTPAASQVKMKLCSPRRVLLVSLCFSITLLLLSTSSRPEEKVVLAQRMSKITPKPSPTQFQVPEVGVACISESRASIGNLYELLTDWSLTSDSTCREAYQLLVSQFIIDERKGKLEWSAPFGAKMLRWLGNNTATRDDAMNQKIIYIRNNLTEEESIFNPLRQMRPKPEKKGISDLAFIEDIVQEAAKKCDFCNYQNNTAFDTYGRIDSTYCVTAANAFKLDVFHSLILLKKHHPLHWGIDHITDVFHVAQQWFDLVVASNKDFIYPSITWDLLPHSGGSQIHPHLHAFLKPHTYYGYQQHWYGVAVKYGVRNPGRNFFTDYVTIHDRMGLAIKHGTAVALTHLTPRKENEVMILSREINTDFLQLLYATLRTYIDRMGLYSFSMAISLPIMGQPVDSPPVVARLLTRGSSQSIVADFSSLEIFAASSIDTDLFKFAKTLKSSIPKIIAGLKTRSG